MPNPKAPEEHPVIVDGGESSSLERFCFFKDIHTTTEAAKGKVMMEAKPCAVCQQKALPLLGSSTVYLVPATTECLWKTEQTSAF